MHQIKVCVFDAYGTLFDVAAAAREAAAEPGGAALAEIWEKLARDWRLKQLQYTWLRAVSGTHADFWQITQVGLDWALEASGIKGDGDLRARLLDLYFELSAYPEVPQMLERLKGLGKTAAILSNGEPKMLAGAVESAGIGHLLDDVLSVESVGVFKPHPSTYDLVGNRFGIAPAEVLFVSSNGWDAAHAAGRGFVAAWANRSDEPMERLPWKPAHILSDLTRIPEIAAGP